MKGFKKRRAPARKVQDPRPLAANVLRGRHNYRLRDTRSKRQQQQEDHVPGVQPSCDTTAHANHPLSQSPHRNNPSTSPPSPPTSAPARQHPDLPSHNAPPPHTPHPPPHPLPRASPRPATTLPMGHPAVGNGLRSRNSPHRPKLRHHHPRSLFLRRVGVHPQRHPPSPPPPRPRPGLRGLRAEQQQHHRLVGCAAERVRRA